MAQYKIPIYGTVSATVEVEADDYDEAVDLALQNAPQTSFAFTGFSPVDEWGVADDYERDGEWINTDNPTHGE